MNGNGKKSKEGVTNMKRSIMVTIALLSSMFVALVPASAPGNVIEKPDWNVGDSWSMGKTVDLSQYEQEIQTALEQLGEGNSMEMSGGVGYYQTMKVVNDDYMIDNVKHYRLSIKAAFGANIEIDMTMSMDDDFTGPMSMNGWITAVIDVWIDGYAYFTIEDLAIKKVELVIKADMKIEAEMEMTQSGMTQSMTILMEASSLEIEFDVEFIPAIDIFDFPIEDGETWWIPEVDTEMDMSMYFDGSIKMKMSSGGLTLEETLDLSDPMYQIDSTTIIDKHSIELTAAKSGSHYDIGIGTESLPMDFLPIDDIVPIAIPEIPFEMTLQYNPEKGFVEGVGTGEDGGLALEPVSESDVDAFYADPSGSVPGPGLGLWLILLIILIVAVVVIVIAAVLVRRRRRKRQAEGVYGPPGAPPQPGVQPYPPQQPLPPPQAPPPQQPYPPPPPPPPSG